MLFDHQTLQVPITFVDDIPIKFYNFLKCFAMSFCMGALNWGVEKPLLCLSEDIAFNLFWLLQKGRRDLSYISRDSSVACDT